MNSLNIVLQGLFIGTVIAILTVGYNKLVIGKFVKALIKAEAVHPAFAKTFDDLKLKKNFVLAFALRHSGTLRKIVAERDSNKQSAYYIPEDKLYRAGRLYGGKDVDVLMISAAIIIMFIFFALVILYLPNLLQFVSDTIPLPKSNPYAA